VNGPVPAAPARLTAQYEQLRAQAVAGSAAVAAPLGLAVFLRRGLAAWLALGPAFIPSPRTERPIAVADPSVALPIDLHAQAVRVLASMALAVSQKEGS
jgi:hypothetical protein